MDATSLYTINIQSSFTVKKNAHVRWVEIGDMPTLSILQSLNAVIKSYYALQLSIHSKVEKRFMMERFDSLTDEESRLLYIDTHAVYF